MLTKLLLEPSEKLAERILASVTLPCLGFWFVGALVFYMSPEFGWAINGVKNADIVERVLLLASAIGAVLVSGGVVSYFAPAVLKLMLGDWPAWLDLPRGWLTRRQQALSDRSEVALQALARKIDRTGWEALSPAEIRAYSELERMARHYPPDPRHLMPTQLGNVLRAAESRPAAKYGLEPAIIWPRLELVAAPPAIALLKAIQGEFQTIGRLATWAALLPLWLLLAGVTGVAWRRFYPSLLLLPAAVFLAMITYRRALDILERFAETFEAMFDLYRVDLYQALRWPLPAHARDESRLGRALTAYLLRASIEPTLQFAPPVERPSSREPSSSMGSEIRADQMEVSKTVSHDAPEEADAPAERERNEAPADP